MIICGAGNSGRAGIDTAALTAHLRTRGAMSLPHYRKSLRRMSRAMRHHRGRPRRMDYVREVTTPNVFQWDPDGELSRKWVAARR